MISTYLLTEIPCKLLDKPTFDLIGWYCALLQESGIFHNNYKIFHKGKYTPSIDNENLELDDIPGLTMLGDDEEDNQLMASDNDTDDAELLNHISEILSICQPYPGDNDNLSLRIRNDRFQLERENDNILCIYDGANMFKARISLELAHWTEFSIAKWFAEHCTFNEGSDYSLDDADLWMKCHEWNTTTIQGLIVKTPTAGLSLNGVQVDKNKYPAVQCNTAKVEDKECILHKLVVLRVEINRHPACALVDCGSLGDFMLSTLVDQLKLSRRVLNDPVGLQLAVQGSRSKILFTVDAHLVYQDIFISERWTFDIINLNDYDVILGTPWLYQHKVSVRFNPAQIGIGSRESLPITVGKDTRPLLSTVALKDLAVTHAHKELLQCAEVLYRKVEETELSYFWDINHTIPLIDENKTYPWHALHCPEVFRGQWAEKRDA